MKVNAQIYTPVNHYYYKESKENKGKGERVDMHLQITNYFGNTRLPNKLLTDTIIHIYNNEYLQCGDSSHPGESQLTDDLNSCKKMRSGTGKRCSQEVDI